VPHWLYPAPVLHTVVVWVSVAVAGSGAAGSGTYGVVLVTAATGTHVLSVCVWRYVFVIV